MQRATDAQTDATHAAGYAPAASAKSGITADETRKQIRDQQWMAWLGGWAQIAATGPAAPNRPGRTRLPAVYRSWRGRPDDRFWGRRDAPEPRPTPGKRRGSPRRPGGGQRGRGVALQGAGSTTDWVVIRRACAPGRRRGNPWMSKTDNRAAANDGDGNETSGFGPSGQRGPAQSPAAYGGAGALATLRARRPRW